MGPNKIFLLIVVGILCYSTITTSVSVSASLLYVSSTSGSDVPDCGLNQTLACKSLNYTMDRGEQVTPQGGTLSIICLEDVISETVSYIDSNHTFSLIIFEREGGNMFEIRDSSIYILARVQFSNVSFIDSELSTGALTLLDSAISNTPLVATQHSYITNSTISKSKGIYDRVTITDSQFFDSPVEVTDCEITGSSFRNSSSQPALTVNSCTVKNSVFVLNSAEQGAAIHATFLLKIYSSVFSSNTASLRGGAIYAESDVTLDNTHILNNKAGHSGGGIFLKGGKGSIFMQCAESNINSNTASEGGGMALSTVALTGTGGCTFNSNKATVAGGGVYFHNSTVLSGFTWDLRSNLAPLGGGMYMRDSSLIEVAGSLTYNDATTAGSAIYANNSKLILENVNVAGKTFNNSVIALYGSAYFLGEWKGVTFSNDIPQEQGLYCDDCQDILCKASKSCGDCPYSCLTFSLSSLCTQGTTKYGCWGASTCLAVSNKQPKCKCPSGYQGDTCSQLTPPSSPLKLWEVILIAVGGLIVLFTVIVGVIVIIRRKRKDYSRIEQ